MFGGGVGSTVLSDLWEWDGTDWQEQLPVSLPPTRIGTAMSYDAARGTSVVFGGFRNDEWIDDSWEWNGTAWTEYVVALRPGARYGHAMVYDAVRSRVVLFGGSSDSGRFEDTWTLQHGAGIDESCTTGFDGDYDGLVGCDDPDCWGRCTPSCPPGTTCNSSPRCGDGVCNTFLETPRLCPADCGAPAPLCGDFHCDTGESASECPGDCTP